MFRITQESRWIKISLITLISIFFILNLFAALHYGNQNYLGSFEKFDNDDVKYIRSAWNLVDTGQFIYQRVNEPTVYIMPGLPFSLAFFVELFGKIGGVTAFRVFQAILQALSLYLVFLIGRKLFNSKTALIACLINSLYIVEYYVSTIILTEVLFKFLLLLLIYISIYALEERKLFYYIVGGIIWGLCCLIRPTIAAFPAVILLMWIIKKYSFKEMVKYALVTILMFTVVMSPWWLRNYIVFDKFIPLTVSSGNPFLQGTYINYDQSVDYTPYELGETAIETNENETKAGLYRLKTYAIKEPGRYALWYTLGKSRILWNNPFYWKETFGVPFVAAKYFHQLILLLGVIETIILFVKKQKKFMFLFLTAAYFSLIYLPYFTMARYSYPIMPIVFIMASLSLYRAGGSKAARGFLRWQKTSG